MGLRAFLTNRRWLIMLAGTAGTWFLLDYAYYGNTISTPQILGLISPHASTMTKIALQLAIFVVAAVPGLRAGDRPAGPDRAPAAAADRLRDDGAVFPGHRGGAGHDHHGGPVPAGVRGELLLHRVRPEHDHVRDAQRAVPGDHARDRARDLRRASASSARSSGSSCSRCCRRSLGLRGTLLLTAGVSVLGLRCSPWCCPSRPGAAWKTSPPPPPGRAGTGRRPLPIADKAPVP